MVSHRRRVGSDEPRRVQQLDLQRCRERARAWSSGGAPHDIAGKLEGSEQLTLEATANPERHERFRHLARVVAEPETLPYDQPAKLS